MKNVVLQILILGAAILFVVPGSAKIIRNLEFKALVVADTEEGEARIPFDGDLTHSRTIEVGNGSKKKYRAQYHGRGRFPVYINGSQVGRFSEKYFSQIEFNDDGSVNGGVIESMNYIRGYGWTIVVPKLNALDSNTEFISSGYFRNCAGMNSTCVHNPGKAHVRFQGSN